MKPLQFIGPMACLAFFVSCETTQTTAMGNQERKRLAALQQEQQQPQPDEAQQNLWSAQQNAMNTDGSPMRRY